MKLSRIFIIALFLITAGIPIVAGAPVAPYGNVSGSYNNTTGSDDLYINTNIPLTMEEVAFPPLLFYFFVALGSVCILAGIWFISRPDQIPSYAIMGCGLLAFGAFAIAAVMAPLVASSGSTVHIIPGTPNSVYVTEVNTYIFSSWVGWAMWGGALAGFVVFILGTLSMFRTNKEKSIEQSVDQDGEKKYKGWGKKYSED